MTVSLRQRAVSVLRSLERYTQTDMVYFAQGTSWLFFGQAAISFLSFILAVAFANLLSPDTYGSYRYVLSLAGIISLFALPGMRVAVVQAAAQGRESVIYAATRERVVGAFIGAGVTACGAAYYFFIGQNTTLAVALLLIAITLPVFETFDLYGSYLNGKRDFSALTRYAIITQGISVAILVGTIYVTNSLFLILLAYLLPLTLLRLFYYRFTTRLIPHANELFVDVRRYGRHQTFMSILSVIAQSVDKLLLWHLLGPVEVAVYTFALALPEQAKGALKTVGDLALPRYAARTEDELRRALPQFWRKLALYAIAVLVLSFIYIALAPLIYRLFFPKYLESVRYSQIFALSLFTVVSAVPTSLLTAQRKLKEQYAVSFFQPVLQIVLFVILIPLYGIAGAIMTWVVTRIVSLLYICVLTQRALRSPSQAHT